MNDLEKMCSVKLPTENLSVGMVVKNYRELCRLLDQPALGGNAKDAQLKLFSCNFAFTKNKGDRVYTIDAIYPKPLEKTRKVSTTTVLQTYSILHDLCDEIYDVDAEDIIEVTRTKKQLQILLGICNDEFYENKKYATRNTPAAKSIYSRSIFSGIPLDHVLDFYSDVDSRGRGYISRLIESINSQHLVTVWKTYEIQTSVGIRVCDNAQHILIEEAIGRTLLLPKYQRTTAEGIILASNEKDIFLQRQYTNFCKDILKDHWVVANGIKRIYPTYKFSFTKDLVQRLNSYATVYNITPELCIEQLNKGAIKYHDSRTDKRVAVYKREGKSCLLPDDYIEQWVEDHYISGRKVLKKLIEVNLDDKYIL